MYIRTWDTDIGFTINALNGDKIPMEGKHIQQIDNYTNWLKEKANPGILDPPDPPK